MHTPVGSPKDSSFRVTLSMKKEPGGGPIFCKVESTQRFKQMKTVKLNANTNYRIDVTFRPPRTLQTFLIQGTEIEALERFCDSVICAYSIYYSTDGFNPSKKGERQELIIQMKVLGAIDLSTTLQVKMYKEDLNEQCHKYDSRLHCIELDCSNVEGDDGTTVQKQTYNQVNMS